MEKIIVNNIEYEFIFSESSECWIGNVVIDNNKINLEIYLSNFIANQFNWQNVKEFIEFIKNKSSLETLISTSEQLLLAFADIVSFNIDMDIKRYNFKLSTISYRGKIDSRIFEEKTHNYSLFFNLYSDRYIESEDPYGNYIVDIENSLITGVRREQL